MNKDLKKGYFIKIEKLGNINVAFKIVNIFVSSVLQEDDHFRD